MPTTVRTATRPTVNSDVLPPTARATHVVTDATGGTHRTSASHQSTLDGYQCIVSVDIGVSVVADGGRILSEPDGSASARRADFWSLSVILNKQTLYSQQACGRAWPKARKH